MARPRTIAVDEMFFSRIDSDQKAYWLGFLMADGCNTGRSVMLGLATKDAAHVQEFVATVKSEAQITSRVNNFGSSFVTVSVCSTRMCADLSRHGVVKAKTSVATFPQVRRALQGAFVRGVFDGDGCIHVKQIAGGAFPTVSITGAPKLVKGLQDWCKSIGIQRARIRKHYHSDVVKVVWLTNIPDVVAFRDAIYRNATVALERKRHLLNSVALIAPRNCETCGAEFQPRYRTKGRYCSLKCYHRVYYAANRDVKWKANGEWK